MALRPIITIDEEKCDGCGVCISSCAEGALKIVNGKARLVSDQVCDGLGACLKECPRGALTVDMRDAVPYDEAAVLTRDGKGLAPSRPALGWAEPTAGGATVGRPAASPSLPTHPHVEEALGSNPGLDVRSDMAAGGRPAIGGSAPAPSLQPHDGRAGHHGHGGGGCPGAASRQFHALQSSPVLPEGGATRPSALTHWPVQLHLAHPGAPQYQGARLLLCADCVPFSMAGFHERLLAGRSLLVACPKLDDPEGYLEKLEHLFAHARPESVTVARMQVPCCGGLLQMALLARQRAGSDCPVHDVVVGLRGEELARRILPAEGAGRVPANLSP